MLLEVELMGLADIPTLQAAVNVLGNVKSTPRYGTTGEVWHGGIWREINFDTTLVDRFIIDATEEKAIALSVEPWVEWTAPAKTGTVYDGKTIQWWNVMPLTQIVVGVVLPIATGLGVVRFGKKG
mgnify:CR=1 FL=1